MEDIKVMIPQNAADLEELVRLDQAGKLMHGGSYPDLSEKKPQINFHVITTQQSSNEEQNNDNKK